MAIILVPFLVTLVLPSRFTHSCFNRFKSSFRLSEISGYYILLGKSIFGSRDLGVYFYFTMPLSRTFRLMTLTAFIIK